MVKPMPDKIKNKLKKLLANEIDMALKRRVMRVIQELKIQPKDRVLEVGCGPGYFLRILNKLYTNIHLYGVDVDDYAINESKKIANIKVSKLDITKVTPFKENFFDKIFASEVLEHIDNDNEAVRNIFGILKPGGRLVITVPNKKYPFLWDPVNWLTERLTGDHFEKGFWAGIWSNHIRLYSIDGIKKLLVKNGFSIVKIEPITWWSLPFNHNLLYGGKMKLLPGDLSKKVLKQVQSESTLRNGILSALNLNDKLNNISMEKVGVSILVVAQK